MNETAFLSALHDDPDDEVTWLALADWLDEGGQADRSELVRLARRLRALPPGHDAPRRRELEARRTALLMAGVRPAVPERVDRLGMRFALVPAGRFWMGLSPEAPRTEPRHEVTLTRPFYLGVFAVTQRQYELVTGHNPSYYSREGSHREDVAEVSDDRLANFPVENVSWHDAQGFVAALAALAQKNGERLSYRLPTEAEWEFACRAFGTGTFHFGEEITGRHANFEDRDVSAGRPQPVGSYAPNGFGLYDMHGNVFEWVEDAYEDYPDGPVTDPRPTEGEMRTSRGGSHASDPEHCRCGDRGGEPNAPEERFSDVGFRVVAVPLR